MRLAGLEHFQTGIGPVVPGIIGIGFFGMGLPDVKTHHGEARTARKERQQSCQDKNKPRTCRHGEIGYRFKSKVTLLETQLLII